MKLYDVIFREKESSEYFSRYHFSGTGKDTKFYCVQYEYENTGALVIYCANEKDEIVKIANIKRLNTNVEEYLHRVIIDEIYYFPYGFSQSRRSSIINGTELRMVANSDDSIENFEAAAKERKLALLRDFTFTCTPKKEIINETNIPNDVIEKHYKNCGRSEVIPALTVEEFLYTIKILFSNKPQNDICYLLVYLLTDEFKKYIKDTFSESYRLEYNKPLLTYVMRFEKLFEKNVYYYEVRDNAFVMSVIKLKGIFKKNTITLTANTEYELVVGIGNISCKKMLKTKTREAQPFEIFPISASSWTEMNFDFFYGEAENEMEFIIKNQEFFETMHFFDVLRHTQRKVNMRNYIVFFFIAFASYPQIELLLKTGHVTFIENLYHDFSQCTSGDSMKKYFKGLNELINISATSSKVSLRFPSYVSNYLSSTNAGTSEYFFWRDVYEITDISKENFEVVANSMEYLFVKSTVEDINQLDLQEILKYGYKLMNTLSYLVKMMYAHQKKRSEECGFLISDENALRSVVTLLKDTLSMAELMEINAPKYPKNLQQIHDELSESYKASQNEIKNEKVKKLAITCQEMMEKAYKNANAPQTAMELFSVDFPYSSEDFVREGMEQHNCVAHYFERVFNNKCIIFFVRDKRNPNESYITAEVKKDGIGQVMYSNNRPVHKTTYEYQLCEFVTRTLKGLL